MRSTRTLQALALLLALPFAACDKVEQPYETVQDGGGSGGGGVVRKVLLEDMTGHRCNNCPAAAAQATALQGIHGENLVVIAVHCVNGFAAPLPPVGDGILDSDHRTPEGTAYESAFGITFLPTGLISRRPFNSVLQISDGDWGDAVNDIIGDSTAFHLWFDALAVGGGSVSTTVKLALLGPVTGDHNLVVALTEDHIIDWQIDVNATPPEVPDYEHRHMLRGNLNGTWGVPAIVGSAAAGDTLTFTYTNPLPASVLNPDNCALVAYVYDDATKEVMQVEERKFQP